MNWRGHELRRVKVGHRFKLGVWLGGYLVVPSEESSYAKEGNEWFIRKWAEYNWELVI